MNTRTILAWTMAALGAATLTYGQQQPTQSGQPDAYQGVSLPPNDPIMTTTEAPAKPAAGVPAAQPPASPQPTPAGMQVSGPAPQQSAYAAPGAMATAALPDPDGDIVQPRPARPGELMEGATIRVKLLDRLSSTESEKGERFHGQVDTDVLQDGRVLIPAGSGIEGRVSYVSSGHFGGHGSLRLRPETVILPDGSRFRMFAETTGTPGSKTRMGAEGSINPGSRAKRDGVEYGALVGAGAVTGAVVAGPVGALTGGLIGAGVVTTHLMVDHPQATLEPGSIVLFTLTDSMDLTPSSN